MQEKTGCRYSQDEAAKVVLALKVIRLKKGLSRQEAGKLCGWTRHSIEQLENGHCNFSKARIRWVVGCLGVSWNDFEAICRDPKRHLAACSDHKFRERTLDRKPRRNHYKIVTKAVRVVRVLRKRKQISQYQASRLCGYVPSSFGQIEAGRIELTNKRLKHILDCLGYKLSDFECLMNASVLRDQVIDEAVSVLNRLDEESLKSAVNVINAFAK